MFSKKFSLFSIFCIIIIILGLSISLGSVLAVWTPPTAIPPTGNIAAPINVSATGQAKQGGLILNTNGSTNGLVVQFGNVGIGTTAPGNQLHVYSKNTQGILIGTPYYDSEVTRKNSIDFLAWRDSYNGNNNFVGASISTARQWTCCNGFPSGGYAGVALTNLIFSTRDSWDVGIPPAERMRITYTGNVGIGTTGPASNQGFAFAMELSDSGATTGWDLMLTNPTAGTNEFLGQLSWNHANDALAAIASKTDGATDAGHLEFQTQATGGLLNEKVRITSTGNVGIGTTNPQGKLHLFDGSQTTGHDLILSRYWGGANNVRGSSVFHYYNATVRDILVFGVAGDIAGGGSSYTSPNTLAAAKMVIQPGGNIGIGTTGPGLKLHVDTGNTNNGALLLTKATAKPAFSVLPWDSQVYVSAGTYYQNGTWVQQSDSNDNLLFVLDPGGGARWYASNNGSGSWNVANDQQLWNPSGNWSSLVQSTKTGDSYFTGGNVGIGIAVPVSKLNINETTGTVNGANRGSLIIDHENGGGVSSVVFRSRINRGSDYGYIQYQDAPTVGGGGESARLYIGTSNDFNDHLILWPSGNVGIATNNPGAKLEVAGQIKITGGSPGINKVLISDATGLASWSSVAGLPSGTSGQTLRHNGTSWLANSVIYNNGTNVGIGTAGPISKLDVQGDVFLASGNKLWSRTSGTVGYNAGITLFDGSGNMYLTNRYGVSASNGRIYFQTSDIHDNPETRMTITKQGNVGIGTTGPQNKLHIVGNLEVGGHVDEPTNAIRFGTGNQSWIGHTTSGRDMLHIGGFSDGSSRMVGIWDHLYVNGNVGIGTTNPQSKLQIVGPVEISRKGVYGTYDSTQVQGVWTIGRNYQINDSANTFGSQYGIVYAHTNAGTSGANKPIAGWGHQILFTDNGSYKAAVSLSLGNGYFAGNVGIGTTNPGAKLEVAGQIKITGGSPGINKVLISDATGLASWSSVAGLPLGTSGQTLRHDGTSWLANSVIYNNGTNVGIGTTGPGNDLPNGWNNNVASKLLEIASGGIGYDSGILLRRSDSITGLDLWSDNSTGDVYIDSRYNSGYGDIRLRTKTSGTPVDAMTIIGNGNVGIGTTNPGPGDILAVRGSSPAIALVNSADGEAIQRFKAISGGVSITSDAGDSTFHIRRTTGNVGIGTVNPTEKLDVNGTVKATSLQLSSSFCIIKKDNSSCPSGFSESVQALYYNPTNFECNTAIYTSPAEYFCEYDGANWRISVKMCCN